MQLADFEGSGLVGFDPFDKLDLVDAFGVVSVEVFGLIKEFLVVEEAVSMLGSGISWTGGAPWPRFAHSCPRLVRMAILAKLWQGRARP